MTSRGGRQVGYAAWGLAVNKGKRFAVGMAVLATFWVLTACGGYTDPFGNSYSDEQVSQYCSHLRPGSAGYERYDCANRLVVTP